MLVFQCHIQSYGVSGLTHIVPGLFSPHIRLAAWTPCEPCRSKKGETSLSSCLWFPFLQKSRLAKQALGPLTVYKLIALSFLFSLWGPVMSLEPNCNGSHVIKVGGFEQRVRGEWRHAPLGPIVLSPSPPWVFPCHWRARQMDITDE